MTENALLKILPFLTKKEMTRFRAFAFSPYFNKHSGVQKLVEYLSATYPNFDEKKYNRRVLYRSLFLGKAHDQPKLALIFTYTLRLLEKFIQVESCRIDEEFNQPHRLLHFLRERDVSFYLEKRWKENFKGGNYQHVKTRKAWAAEMDASAMKLGHFEHDFLAEKQNIIDHEYLKEKLKDACELLLRSKYLKRAFHQSSMLTAACEELERNQEKYHEKPAAILYMNCYKLLAEEGQTFEHVFQRLENEAPNLAKIDLQNLFNNLQNFCIAQINQGKVPFLRHLFNIYCSQLDRGLLFVNERLPEWHFKNIVTTGLRLNEHEWVRVFLDEYRPRLPVEVAENAYGYNLAAYFYHLKKYDEVLRLLVQVDYTDLRYNLDAKSLLLRTYFDLEEEEPFLALCDAFRQYLKRNKNLTEFQKKGYVSLIKYTRKLFRLKTNRGFWSEKKWKAEKEKIQSNIEKSEAVFNKKWLDEKLAIL